MKIQKPSPERVTLRPSSKEVRVHHEGQPKAFLAAEGEEVELSTYWRRRLLDGDVEVVAGKPPREEGEALPVKSKAKPSS